MSSTSRWCAQGSRLVCLVSTDRCCH